MMKDKKRKHPVQEVVIDEEGRPRFVENRLVRHLADAYGLNELTARFRDRTGEHREDWEQLAQLIGYSVQGFGDLSYVSDETYNEAMRLGEQARTEGKKDG